MKVGVFAADIPSTSFIERLIDGLSNHASIDLYVFGKQKKATPTYKGTVNIIGIKNKFHQLLLGCIYRFLFLFKPSKWKAFKNVFPQNNTNLKSKLLAWGKVLPIVYSELDIFHIQWAKNLPEWVFLEELGVKVICSLRGAHINYSPIANSSLAAAYHKTFPKCSGFHGVSKAIIKEATKYGDIESKSNVVYSGLDLSQFSYKSREHSTNAKFKIISVGRPHWKKGYINALDTCKILMDASIEYEYCIVGGSNDEILFQIQQLNLEDHVIVKKHIPFKEVKKLIQGADLLLLPSVEEGIANVVLESMALGTLVLSTDCGGMDEVILNRQTGFIVPVRNPKAIADRIEEIIALPYHIKEEITSNARQMIERQHSEGKMIKDMVTLYQQTRQNVSA